MNERLMPLLTEAARSTVPLTFGAALRVDRTDAFIQRRFPSDWYDTRQYTGLDLRKPISKVIPYTALAHRPVARPDNG